MRKIHLFTFPILFISNVVSSQQDLPEYGKISMEELQMNSCSFEPGAAAMKLFDKQEIEFEFMTYGARMKTERRIRIKIFNEKGYPQASIKIPYLNKKFYGKMRGLKGIVYNLDANGKIVKHELKEEDFYKQKAGDNFGVVNFTFPNLKPGSVVEYSYTRIEKNLIQLDPWLIQDEIPIAYSTNIITTPRVTWISSKAFGTDTIESNLRFLGDFATRRSVTYFKSNIPSFKQERFMNSKRDNLMRVIYFMIPNGNYTMSMVPKFTIWNAVTEVWKKVLYKEHVEKQIPGTEKITDSALKINNVSERIAFIYEKVNKHNRFVPEQTLNIESLPDAWKNQATTTSELNLILINLLHHSNVRAYPLLVSTRENGKIDQDFPSFAQFNGIDVVAYYDSSNFYIMDASIPDHSHQIAPFNILNRLALYVNPGETQWFTISDPRPLFKQQVNIIANMTPKGVIEGTATIQHYDYAKTFKLDSAIANSQEKFYDNKPTGLKIISVKQENGNSAAEPLKEISEFSFETEQTNDIFYINSQLYFDKPENPFKADKRNFEIDLGFNQEITRSLEINLPAGYLTDELPRDILLTTPDSSISYSRKMSSHLGRVSVTHVYEIKRPIFEVSEYGSLQDFYKRLNALMNEMIVVRKKI